MSREMLDRDEIECTIVAIDFFLKQDLEYEGFNGWIIDVLKDARKKLERMK